MKDLVSLEIMRQPVVLVPCGHSLDQRTAEQIHGIITKEGQCENQRTTCSLCRKHVTTYVPNHALRDVIERIAGASAEQIAALPKESLVIEERGEQVDINSIPFPGMGARFVHNYGNWERMSSGADLVRIMKFKSATEGSLFYEFSLLGYRDGTIRISVDTKARELVANYLQQLQFVKDFLWGCCDCFRSETDEDTRTLFTILARNNEIPAEYYDRMKQIVESGHWD